MEPQRPKRNYFTSIYKHDTSDWGGLTYSKFDSEPYTTTPEKMATRDPTIQRSIKTASRGILNQTPTTTYRVSYCSNVLKSRSDNQRTTPYVPKVPPPPDAPDPTLLRPTTENRSRYVYPISQPFISDETIQRCQTAKVSTRSLNNQLSPTWDTTYRHSYCNPVTQTHYSNSITYRRR